MQIESDKQRGYSSLILEKIGFGQSKKAKEAVLAHLSFNKEKIKKSQVDIHEIGFKLTDHMLDFNSLYNEYLETKNTKDINPRRKPLKRIGIIMDALKNRNIDIQEDSLGILSVNYKSQTSFVKKLENNRKYDSKKMSFEKSIKCEIDYNNSRASELDNSLELKNKNDISHEL